MLQRMIGRLALILAVVGLNACVTNVPPDVGANALVERSRWTIETFKKNPEPPNAVFREQLQTAKGVIVFPRVFKGAFVFGAEGGDGVLLTRRADGSWGYPVFYTLGSGSFGLQAGAQASEIVLLLRTDRAVRAVIEDQGKFGADMELTVGNIGAGIGGATTTNFGADIIAIAQSSGVYGGLSLEGAAIVRRNDLNQAYYGTGATPESIVFQDRFANPHADGLRSALVF